MSVEIEADIENGLVALLLVGLPDTALREARDRIRSAIVNSRRALAAAPDHRRAVARQPAQAGQRLRRRHRDGDPVGRGLGAAAGELAGTVFLGELGLDGRLRPVPGVLPSIAAAAAARGSRRAVVPPENAAEAALVPGMQVVSRREPRARCSTG